MSSVKETNSRQHGTTRGQTAALDRSKRVSLVSSIYSHSQSSNDITRLSGNIPTHLHTWEQQGHNRIRISSGGDVSARSTAQPVITNTLTTTSSTTTSGAARRILPSPASNKVFFKFSILITPQYFMCIS